ncbi:MAG: DUF1702 family protein, partial [Ktedonobacteraceae bacterium]|nr:DUF1702 family protein [Ktedonobacteraceae bacterium]
EEASFARRGFHDGNIQARQQLELRARTFIQGYSMALEAGDSFETLVCGLESFENEVRGFAYEGAGMGLALLDYFTPWKKRLPAFMSRAGNKHIYVLHVGAGWTLGRLPQRYSSFLAHYDPLLRWLTIDGYGFHEGFFASQRALKEQVRPHRLSGCALHAFDQGLGRSLWFVKGADVEQIVAVLKAFPEERQADLWSGVGLACAYAGGALPEAIQVLHTSAQNYRPHLAQGAAFAAKTRQRAGNATSHTDLVCHMLCGVSACEAAQVTDSSLRGLPQDDTAYETWRERIRDHFAEQAAQQKGSEQSHASPCSQRSSNNGNLS